MVNKMYLNEEEAAAMLNVTTEQLTEYARQGKLQQYRDGAKIVYRADQVEQLIGQPAPAPRAQDTGEIELAPADTVANADAVSLSETQAPASKDTGKEDTVITAEGVSVFDDEDLDIEAADPMAKTQVAPSLEDQIAIEGVGSGSGLLDLTRESDDTSLGAEVLDHIDMESGIAAGLETGSPAAAYSGTGEAIIAVEAPTYIEAIDPIAGLFRGLVVGSAIVALLLVVAMMSAMTEQSISVLETLKDKMALAVGGVAVLVIACGVIGLVLGKSAVTREIAMRRAGG